MNFDKLTNFKLTPDGKEFLMFENKGSNNRILIFSTLESL